MNNWYVITGAPSSGKTTVLHLLEKRGYRVQHESARMYIDQEITKGKTLEEIRKSEIDFQKKVLELKINYENLLPKNELVFLDRGLPDTIAYMIFNNCTDSDAMKTAANCSYRKVFLFERLNFTKDYARTESEEEALLIENLLERSYKGLRMDVIKVPKMSPEKRLAFILDNL